MEMFTYSVDLARIVFLIGALLAMLYKKRLGVTPGGIIVPAFLALLLDQSVAWFAGILAVALATRYIYKLAFESFALSKKWMIFTNISISALLVVVLQILFLDTLPSVEAATFGFVIPGLISANSVRYGLGKVMQATLLVTAGAFAAGVALAELLPFGWSTYLTSQLSGFAPLKMTHPQIYLPAGLVVTGLTLWQFGTRTGDYLLAPFLAVLAMVAPLQMAMFALGVALSYLIVQLAVKYSLIAGLERFMLCLFTSAFMVSLTDLLAVRLDLTGYRSTGVLLMVAMGVIVNDLCLQRRKGTALAGVSLPVAIGYGLRMVVR